MKNDSQDPSDQSQIDLLIATFFAAFDNRAGRVASKEAVVELFTEKAIVAKHGGGQIELSSPEEFAEPRVQLLRSGDLTGFHEWEESAETEIRGSLAVRRSRYAKSGSYHGSQYAGTGAKYFQLAKQAHAWKIVALSWIDDAG